MNPKTIIAVVLITLGCVVLFYSGISFSTPGETVDFLGMRLQTRDTHFIPPVFGVLGLVAGLILLLIRPKSA